MKPISGLALIGLALALSSCSGPRDDTLPEVRRIVTTEGEDGKSLVLADGPSPNVVELNGSRIERLWETQAMPVKIPVDQDFGMAAGNAYREGFVGSSLYIADIPPGSGLADIPLHKQDSLDYIALLAGEIDLVLDNGETLEMKPGDVLVQAGNAHSWVNRGKAPARLLCVVLTGERRKDEVQERGE